MQPWLPGNHYDNFHGGAARPSYVRWNHAEPWKIVAGEHSWRAVLAAKPDLIVVSLTAFKGNPAALLPAACRAEYGATRTFAGRMMRRNSVHEDDTLVLFEPRGSNAPC